MKSPSPKLLCSVVMVALWTVGPNVTEIKLSYRQGPPELINEVVWDKQFWDRPHMFERELAELNRVGVNSSDVIPYTSLERINCQAQVQIQIQSRSIPGPFQIYFKSFQSIQIQNQMIWTRS